MASRRLASIPAAILIVAGVATCTDSPTQPRQRIARIALAPGYSAEVREIARELAAAALEIDKVSVKLRRGATVIAEKLVDFPAGATEVRIELEVALVASAEQLTADVELRSGSTPIFTGSGTVMAGGGGAVEAQPVNVDTYVGPGASATRLALSPGQATIAVGRTQQYATTGFDNRETVVADLPIVGFETSDPSIATVNSAGLAQAANKVGTVTITARALNKLVATATLRVVGAPARLAATNGAGQSGPVGTTLPQPFTVQLLSAENEGVPGIAVTFAALTEGGSVATATATTDAHGMASTAMTLGSTATTYVYRASVAGSVVAPLSITAMALAAPAAAIEKVSGDGQIGVAGQLLAEPLVVRVTDAFGNAVGGATVTFTRIAGTGIVGTPSLVTSAAGIASTAYTLGAVSGVESIRAQVEGVSTAIATFNVGANPGNVARVVLLQPPAAPTRSGQPFTLQPIVQLRDGNDNIVTTAGITVSASVSPAAYSLVGTTAMPTNANGAALFTNLGIRGPAGTASLTLGIPGTATVTVNLQVIAGPSATMAPSSETTIAGAAGSSVSVAQLPAVLVRDTEGNPVPNVSVSFSVTNGFITSAGGQPVKSLVVITNANGVATIPGWTLSTIVGSDVVTATLSGVTGSPISFTATVTAGVPASIAKAGDAQSAVVGTTVAVQPAVILRDAFGNAVPGVVVVFAVGANSGAVSSGGSFAPNVSVATDATGTARVTWQLGALAGPNTMTATPAGISAATFTATGIAGSAARLSLTTPPSSPTASGAAFSTQPVIQVRDASGNPTGTPGVVVTASVPAGYALVGSSTATTNASGVATFTTLGVTGLAGVTTIIFAAPSMVPVSWDVVVAAGVAATIAVAPGASQQLSGQVGTAIPLASLPAVIVKDGAGNAVPGVSVSFTVAGGSITTSSGTAPPNPVSATTNASGVATLTGWTLPTLTGSATVTAMVGGVPGSVVFTANVLPGQAATLTKTAGDVQSGVVNTVLGAQPAVLVRDASGNAVPGTPVTFTVGLNSGAVSTNGSTFGTSVVVNADATGIARATWRLGTIAAGQSLTASVPGVSAVVFSATALPGPAVSLGIATPPNPSSPSGAVFTSHPAILRLDAFGNVVTSPPASIVASVPSPYVLIGTVTVATNAAGIATFADLGVSGPSGTSAIIIFSSSGLVSTTASIALTVGTPASIAATVPTTLTGLAATAVPTAQLPSVVVRDGAGNAVPNVNVGFSVTNGFLLTVSGQPVKSLAATTNGAGIATVPGWTLSTTPGSDAVTATLSGVSGSPVTFTATVSANVPALVTIVDGNGQTAAAGTPVPIAPTVRVTDAFGNVVAGVSVTFSVTSGGGSITAGTAVTNTLGLASVGSWTLGFASSAQTLSANAGALRELNVSFSATATARLTITGAGSGSGTVSSTAGPALSCVITNGVAAATGCELDVPLQTSITLASAPVAGNSFVTWGGACTGSANCVPTMDQARTVTARFEPFRTLIVSPGAGNDGNGTVTTPPGLPTINCIVRGAVGTGTCVQSYPDGTTFVLTATPDAGYQFTRWLGDGAACGTNPTCSVTMTQNRVVTVLFTRTYHLTITGTGSKGSGTIQVSPGGSSCAVTPSSPACGYDFLAGQVVTLTAQAASGSALQNWGGACSGANLTCTVTMNQDLTVNALFNPAFRLTVALNGPGAGSITSSPSGINCVRSAGSTTGTCAADFVTGADVVLTPSTTAGSFAWDPGGLCGGSGQCTVRVTGNTSVSGTFATPPYQIIIVGAGTGSGTVTSQPGLSPAINCSISNGRAGTTGCSATYPFGVNVTLTTNVAAGSGNTFSSWFGACSGSTPSCAPPSTAGSVDVGTRIDYDACASFTTHVIGGPTQDGSIATNDCEWQTGRYRDEFRFTLASQQMFTTTMAAPPGLASQLIWFSRDGAPWMTGAATSVTQTFLLPAGAYREWATNGLANSTGSYTFSSSVLTAISGCVATRTDFGISDAALTLDPFNDCRYLASNQTDALTPADGFSIWVAPGKVLDVTVFSDRYTPLIEFRDGTVDVIDGKVLATTAGGGGGSTARLTMTGPSGGAFVRIWVAAQTPGNFGPYTLSIR